MHTPLEMKSFNREGPANNVQILRGQGHAIISFDSRHAENLPGVSFQTQSYWSRGFASSMYLQVINFMFTGV